MDAVTSANHGGETNERLILLVGLIAACAGGAITLSLTDLQVTGAYLAAAGLFTAVVVVAHTLRVGVRIGSNYQFLTPSTAVVPVGTAFLPADWVVIATAVGMLFIMLARRKRPIKIGFNVGKEVLAAAVAALATHAVGAVSVLEGNTSLPTRILGLAAATIGYGVVDELCSVPLFALLTRVSIGRIAVMQLRTSLIVRLISFLIALATVWAYAIEPWLVSGLPFLVYTLHLASANQVRSRTEREAWQRLARAMDELNAVDLDKVVTTAVTRAAELFSADEVDLEVRTPDAPVRLIRGDSGGARFDGPAESAPPVTGHVITAALDSYSGDGDVGELRLRFHRTITLSEREQYTLRTFAAALNTAIRNAATFAETRRLADDHLRSAAHDPLTGLANRQQLKQYGAEVLAADPSPGDTALLLIDLNHFREVNETLGHAAGDRLLVEVASRLVAAAAADDLVARLGGDEFAVLFVGLTSPAGAIARAHTMLATLDAPVRVEGMSIGIEASGGVAATPLVGGVDELLRRADVAMYQAKREGRRVAAYARSRDTANVGSLTLGGDLARAINERQFTVDFQPIVDLASGQAIAAEALARWQHPDRGLLGPNYFLDGIERSGLLPSFAEIILDQALTAAGELSAAGYPLDVAVNVSPRSLLDHGFPESVRAALAAHDLPPEVLVVELTESVTLSQLKVVDEVLEKLRSIGVRLALDDFGTGYSSLSTVARVPVYELKIDRGFVAEMSTPAAGAVVRSTIELARSLDLLVVAEGVETEEQRRTLWELGCPAGQGHLFARPMAAHRLISLLRRGASGRPGTLAQPVHDAGSVIRMPSNRRGRPDQQRRDRSG